MRAACCRPAPRAWRAAPAAHATHCTYLHDACAACGRCRRACCASMMATRAATACAQHWASQTTRRSSCTAAGAKASRSQRSQACWTSSVVLRASPCCGASPCVCRPCFGVMARLLQPPAGAPGMRHMALKAVHARMLWLAIAVTSVPTRAARFVPFAGLPRSPPLPLTPRHWSLPPMLPGCRPPMQVAHVHGASTACICSHQLANSQSCLFVRAFIALLASLPCRSRHGVHGACRCGSRRR